VFCVDNFYAGTKRNILHLLGNPDFELVRHNITFVCALVDQNARPGEKAQGQDSPGFYFRGLQKPGFTPSA
jgi:hypothetical protein